MYSAPRRKTRHKASRSGVVTLELILWLPIVMATVLAAIEFGLILVNFKHVQFASRVGAKVAAEEFAGNLTTSISAVNLKVNKALSAMGMTNCKVILEQNVPLIVGMSGCVTNNTQQSTGVCTNCGPPSTTLPAAGTPSAVPGGTVRVTVCVELSQLTPDLLSSFGFSTTGKVVNASTAYPYKHCIEYDPPPVGAGLGPAAMTPSHLVPDLP
jgi:Flp pilus assembly protein TadG